MKKRVLVLMIVLVAMVCGLNQEATSSPAPVTNYMTINVIGHDYIPPFWYHWLEIITYVNHATVTIYNSSNQVVYSKFMYYAGIILPDLPNTPCGTYRAVLTNGYVTETDYFTM